jgi:hypothetical protein
MDEMMFYSFEIKYNFKQPVKKEKSGANHP